MYCSQKASFLSFIYLACIWEVYCSKVDKFDKFSGLVVDCNIINLIFVSILLLKESQCSIIFLSFPRMKLSFNRVAFLRKNEIM